MSENPSSGPDSAQRSPAKILILTCGIGFALAVIAVTLAALGAAFWASANEDAFDSSFNPPRPRRASREVEDFTPIQPEAAPVDIFDELGADD